MKAFGKQDLLRRKPYGKFAHNQSFLYTDIRMFDMGRYLDVELVQINCLKTQDNYRKISKIEKYHSLK